MKENFAKSTLYEIRNVVRPLSLIASRDKKESARRRRRAMNPTGLTYAALIEMGAQRAAARRGNERTLANRTSTLRDFVRRCHFGEQDLIGREMRADFDVNAQGYAKALEEGGTPRRVVTNKLSELRFWTKLLLEWDAERAAANDQPAPFTSAVRQLLKTSPIKTVARQAGVPADMLGGWMRGRLPTRKRSVPSIHRLEVFYGLARGTLSSLVPSLRKGPAPGTGVAPVIPYREDLKRLHKIAFFLNPELGSPLRAQWEDFLRFKTAVRPTRLKRTERGRWRTSPVALSQPTDATWWQFLDGKEVPTAGNGWNQVASYLGWLTLSVEQGGKGLPLESVQTLAWLAVPDHIEAYVDWKLRRTQKSANGSLFMFIAFVASLVRPVMGYLTQQERFQQTLPLRYRSRPWDQLCSEQFDLMTALRNHYTQERTVGRDPFEPISAVLQMAQPMDAIVEMMARLRADRPLAGGIPEAIWARDCVLLKLLISTALRRKSLAQMTWRADNTGNLYQKDDGSWWVRIESKHFKNAAGTARNRTYDTPVLEMAWADIERYVRQFRPMLMREATDLLLLSADRKATGPHVPWKDLSRRVEELTRRYLWRCPGVGAHAFRHLVATSMLKATGNDFKTVALLLNDKMSTVEKHYGHITSSDAATKMAQVLKEQFARL